MSSMVSVCFITDGGLQLGLGHVQQSTTFARTLLPEVQVSFLTKSDDAVLAKIRENGFVAERLGSDLDILRRLKSMDPDVVIFDKLDVAEELARDIKEALNARLVIFTNLSRANRYADIAVTADIGSRFENVSFVDEETKTLCFFGPKYWVLRPEFYDYHRPRKATDSTPERILLMFGGSDPANLTSAALDELLQLERRIKIDVVLGAHFGHDADVVRVFQRHEAKRANVTVYRNIANVAELMYAADLVIAAPGLSAFEALRVGTPVIVVPHDTLQRDTYLGFMRMLERNELSKLGNMIDAGDFTYPHEEQIARMEIGEGIEELKEVIMRAPMRSQR